MRRPYRLTLTCLYDDGLRSKLAYRKTWTLSTLESCKRKQKEILEMNFPEHYSGIVLTKIHLDTCEEIVIRNAWYL